MENKARMEGLLYLMEQTALEIGAQVTKEAQFLDNRIRKTMALMVLECQNQFGVTLRPARLPESTSPE